MRLIRWLALTVLVLAQFQPQHGIVAPCCTWCFAVHQNSHQNLASCLPAFQPAQRFFVVCIWVAMEAWPRLDPFHHFVVDASSYANFESMADRFLVQARESRLTPSQAAEPLSRRSSVSEGPGCAIPPNKISTQGAMTASSPRLLSEESEI